MRVYLIGMLLLIIPSLLLADEILFNDDNLYYWSDSKKADFAVLRIKDLAETDEVLVNDNPWQVSKIGQLLLPNYGKHTLQWFRKDGIPLSYQINKKSVVKIVTPDRKHLNLNQSQTRPNLLPILSSNNQKLDQWGIQTNTSSTLEKACELKGGNSNQKNQTVVILVHGLGRSDWSMAALAKALREVGMATCLVNYPSKHYPIEMLSDWLAVAIHQVENKIASKNSKIQIITHSLGGILTRYALNADSELAAKIDKLVMLAPPNHGSEIIDNLGQYPWFQALQGPAALQLYSGKQGLPAQLPPLDFPNLTTLVIAGTQSSDPWFNHFYHKNLIHDGKVSLNSAKLSGAKILMVESGHTLIMNHAKSRKNMIDFLIGE